MPTFEKTLITNLGMEFLNSLNSGSIKLTSANTIYSSTDLTGMSDDDIKNMNDIQNKELSVTCDIIKSDKFQTKIRSNANNENLTSGLYIRCYATYFVDDAGNKILFAIKVNTKPQYLVAYDGVNTNSQSYGFSIGISQTDNVQFTKLSNLTASVQDLKDLDTKTSSALANKVTFNGGNITTGNGTFVPASINDVTSKIKTNITNGDNFDNYRENGTYPMNGVTIRSIGGSGGLPSFDNFNADLTVTVKGNEIEQFISASNGQRFYRNLGQFWYQMSKKEDLDTLINGLTGVNAKPMGDSDDFYNLPLGIYFVNGTPKNNPYGHACYGTAFSMGGYVQYLDQNGDAFFITPKSGGWLKYVKQADVTEMQSEINAIKTKLGM